VQEVITTGSQITPDGRTHRYIIQKWIAGDTLDMLIKRGITQAEILRVLDDLFLKVVIPLWQAGVVWWDFRLNNMVFTPERKLHMIDSDVLEASAKELLTKPNEFRKRNGHSHTLIERYREWMLQPMLLKCLGLKGESKKQVCAKLDKLFATWLHPVFLEPFPQDAKTTWDGKSWAKRATAAYKSFRSELVSLCQRFSGTQPAKKWETPK
jgi:hypothetical protein